MRRHRVHPGPPAGKAGVKLRLRRLRQVEIPEYGRDAQPLNCVHVLPFVKEAKVAFLLTGQFPSLLPNADNVVAELRQCVEDGVLVAVIMGTVPGNVD